MAEGAGAAALAALIKERTRYAGKRAGVILSGGNIDASILAEILAGRTPSAWRGPTGDDGSKNAAFRRI